MIMSATYVFNQIQQPGWGLKIIGILFINGNFDWRVVCGDLHTRYQCDEIIAIWRQNSLLAGWV